MPAGTRYAVAAHPGFVAEADRLFRASNCTLRPWEQGSVNSYPDIRPADGIQGLRGIQGIFRSCPDVKKTLLDDGSGARVAFVVYPEYDTAGDPSDGMGGLAGYLPRTRIDKYFNTQAVARWALLTSLPAGQEGEIARNAAVWATSSGFAVEGGIPASGTPRLKSLLHCAVEKGSRIPRVSRSIEWTKRSGPTEEQQASFLGLSDASAWSAAFGAYLSQPDPAAGGGGRRASTLFDKIDGAFIEASSAESEWRLSLSVADGKQCPRIEELVYSADPAVSAKWKAKVAAAVGSRPKLEPWGMVGACGFALPSSLALGVVDAPHALQVRLGLEDFVPKANASPEDPACAGRYEAYFREVVPAYKAALETCTNVLAPVGGRLRPVVIPQSACTDDARTELETNSFLSPRTVGEDLGGDEIGELFSFALK